MKASVYRLSEAISHNLCTWCLKADIAGQFERIVQVFHRVGCTERIVWELIQ